MTPYLEVSEAQDYFDERLNTDAWDDASDVDKLKALKMATRIINGLKYIGIKYNISQENEFPRSPNVSLETPIKEACCELALALLDDIDPALEVEQLPIQAQGYSSVKDNYDRSFALDHIRAGIPSLQAWQLLVPYLIDPKAITLKRV